MNMELKTIKDLLEKYYDGATSIEEERIIKEYMRRSDVPAELALDKELFCFLSEGENGDMLNSDIEKKVTQLIDLEEKKERKQRFIGFGLKIATIAASISVIIICYLFIYQQLHELKLKDSYR